jgi:Cu/Ag efflux protein CusF
MKTTAAALIAGSMTLLTLSGAAMAQSGTTTTTPATPATKPADPAKPMATKPAATKAKMVTGEVVAVDSTAKTLTVKHTVNGKPEEMTIGAADKNVDLLNTLKAGDHVQVAYADMDGKLMASRIAKVEKKK